MANYKEQIRDIWKQYRSEVSTDPVDLKEVAAWALSKGLWAPRPIDLSASLAKDLADSLREVKRVDNAGREYRANIPVREKTANGVPLFVWADIDDAPRVHVEKGIQQERRSIQSDCYALAMKAEHYSEAHPTEEPILVVLNFEDDVEEMKIANGLFDSGEEAA
jgi:hypothetical protein